MRGRAAGAHRYASLSCVFVHNGDKNRLVFFLFFFFVREVGKGREEGRGRIVDDMYVVTHVKDIVPMCMCEVCEDYVKNSLVWGKKYAL